MSSPVIFLSATVLLLVTTTAAVLLIPAVRRRLISRPILAIFQRTAPRISATERAALEAGTVGFEGELFSGNPDWQRLAATGPVQLTDAERAFLDGPTETLCAMLDDWDMTHNQLDLPPKVWRYIKQNGFFGMILPREFGGLGFSAYAHSCVVMKLASRSISAAVTVMVPNSLGPGKLLMHYGTSAQKRAYLPRLASGEEIPCFALTSPQAGSDASAIPDRGVVCYQQFEGKRQLGIRVSWDKRYITLAPVATLLGLAFHLFDPDQLLGDQQDVGISVALLPTSHPGVQIGERHFPLNAAFQNGPTRGEDVFIPIDFLIGGAAQAGQGWRMLMESLADGRGISLPALATGAGKFASRFTGAYARIREQFHLPIGKFEGVEEALARIAGETYIMDAGRRLTCAALDQGERPAIVTAMVKYQLTERMRSVLNAAMDIHGGRGICLGPRNYLARAYQTVPIAITVEGANILTRSLIVFGQGALRAHPWLLKELSAARSDNASALRDFDHALFGHLRWFLSNLGRSLLRGLWHVRQPDHWADLSTERGWFRQLERYSAAFALSADVALFVLGPTLKRREKITGRLADVLSQLYLGAAVLRQFQDHDRPGEERALLDWSMTELCHGIESGLIGVLRNLPNRFVGRLLQALIFPRGLHAAAPDDRLGHAIAGGLLLPGALRDRLTAGIYLNADPNDISGRLELAMIKVIEAEPVARAVREASRDGRLTAGCGMHEAVRAAEQAGIISEMQAARWRNAEAARDDAIRVDAFDPDILAHRDSRKNATKPQHKAARRSG